MKKILLTLSIVIFVLLVGGLKGIAPAEAVTIEFQWIGSAGYLAKGSFNYDGKTSPVIFSEQGDGNTDVLQSLSVSFYNPNGKCVATYDNVVNGVSVVHYFKFNFNTLTQQIFGTLDVGGEVSDEIYLKGTVDRNLSLFHVEKSGSEEILDRDSGSLLASRQEFAELTQKPGFLRSLGHFKR